MHRKTPLIVLILIAVSFVSFAPVLRQGFLNWDDPVYVTNNPDVLRLDREHLAGLLTARVEQIFVPLTVFSYALEYHFFGFQPFFYHLDNLLLHAGVVILAFFLGRRLGLSEIAAFLGALFFAVHPMHVESVAWVSERKDVLYSFFYLLALLSYARYVLEGRRWAYWGSVVAGLLSMLAKPMALSLPLTMLLCDLFWKRPRSVKALIDKLPHVAYGIGIGWMTYALHARVPLRNIGEAALLWMWSFGFHIQKFLFPYPLLVLYETPRPVTMANPAYMLSTALFVLLLTGPWLLRKNRMAWFAVAFYALSIFFLLKMDARIDLIMVSDHYMYLPSLGFCYLLGTIWAIAVTGKTADEQRVAGGARVWGRGAALGLLIFALCFSTVRQAAAWGNELQLWERVLAFFPSSIAHDNIGSCYTTHGRFDEAIRHHTQALQILPREDARIYSHRGLAYVHKGEFAAAIEDYTRSLRYDPGYRFAYFNRAIAYDLSGQHEKALADYTMALELQPRNYWAFYLRGVLHHTMGNDALAYRDLDAAIAIYPRFSSAFFIRGQLHLLAKDFDAAIADLSRTIDLKPSLAGAYYKRGLAYQGKGREDVAQRDFATAFKLAPQRNDIRQRLQTLGDNLGIEN